jgi:hypothetical protein
VTGAATRQVRHLLAQVLGAHVGVALRGGDTGVAQQLLHGTEVGPGAEGVGSERVAQQVRPRAVGDADALEIAIHQQSHPSHGEALPPAAEEEREMPVPALREVDHGPMVEASVTAAGGLEGDQ